MSISWLHAEPAPTILVLPDAAASLDEAHDAIDLWEFYTGKVADPSQRLAVEVMMARTAEGYWAARTTGREMPRQNGKGSILEARQLAGLFLFNERLQITGVVLTKLTKAQADYLNVPVEGPYKPEHYRY